MATLLFSVCVVLTFSTLVVFKGEYLAPAVLICSAFTLASGDLVLNWKTWGFSSKNTVQLILVGLISFAGGCVVTDFLFNLKKHESLSGISSRYSLTTDYRMYEYLLIQLVMYAYTLLFLFKTVGMKFSIYLLPQAIGTYYNTQTEGVPAKLPAILNIWQILNLSGTFFLMYLILTNKRFGKNSFIMFLNLWIGILGSLLTGTKTAFFTFIVAWLVMSALVNVKTNQVSLKINFRALFKYVVLICFIFLIFDILTLAQGRTLNDMTAVQLFSTYVGAPLKNLELMVNQGSHNSQIFGAQTFMDTYQRIFKLTGNSQFLIDNQYRYNWINGQGIGNVYTQFMPLYYDFGLSGSSSVMFLLGMFSQYIYELTKFKRVKGAINYWVIYYAYLSFAVIFSFFSNKFFEMVFSRSGIYFIIGLFIFNLFFTYKTEKNSIEVKKYE